MPKHAMCQSGQGFLLENRIELVKLLNGRGQIRYWQHFDRVGVDDHVSFGLFVPWLKYEMRTLENQFFTLFLCYYQHFA